MQITFASKISSRSIKSLNISVMEIPTKNTKIDHHMTNPDRFSLRAVVISLSLAGISLAGSAGGQGGFGQQRVVEDEEPSIKGSSKGTGVSLDPILCGAELWSWTPEKVETDFKKQGFRWLSETNKDRGLLRPSWMWLKNEASSSNNISYSSAKQYLRIFNGGFPSEEAGFDFKGGKLSMVTISLWNKGDSDDITEKDFGKETVDLREAISKVYKVRAQELGKDPASASKAQRVRWETADSVIQLEFSSQKDRARGFQGEFIRLRIAPNVKVAVGTDKGANSAKVSQGDLMAHVKKEANGDVWVTGIPMVDQGDKGYCALASSERVMRYYGIECDQHDMAQATDGGAMGTDPEELQQALHKLQQRFKIHVRDIIEWNITDYEKFTEVYNREAKRIGAKLCPPGRIWIRFSGCNKEALKAVRMKGAGYDRWRKSAIEYTSHGVPLLWGLELGIFPENGKPAEQFGGGHMRLIIGFNEKTNEVIFSDSWGAGHEFKRMDAKDAYAATKGLYMVEPMAR